ncbi:hypothetical protein DFS34DRAFT_182498 [Phlyctochytrium arcticum]|nr:hypothetical protein DFS34DRAFT_182498 [Phlyctochytrium arcticum]
MDEITISGPSKSGAGVAAVLAAGMVAGVIAGGDERNGSDSNSPSQELYIREKTVSQKDEALAETEVIDEDLQSFEADSIGVGADYSQESFEKDDSVVESERRGTDSSSPPDADASIPVKPDLSDPAEASGEKSLDIQLEHTGTPNQESAYSDATGRGMEEMTISGPSKSGAGVVAGLAAGMVTGVVAGVIAGGNDSPHTPEITPPSEQVEDSEYPDEVDEEIESFSEHTPISEIVFPATELTAEQPKPTLATQSTSDGMTQKSLDVHGPTVADVADALNVENQVPQSSTIPEQHETSQAVYPGLTEPSVPKMVDQPMPVQQVSESAIESLTQGFIDALLTDSVEGKAIGLIGVSCLLRLSSSNFQHQSEADTPQTR